MTAYKTNVCTSKVEHSSQGIVQCPGSKGPINKAFAFLVGHHCLKKKVKITNSTQMKMKVCAKKKHYYHLCSLTRNKKKEFANGEYITEYQMSYLHLAFAISPGNARVDTTPPWYGTKR